jgi:hypothetical protein
MVMLGEKWLVLANPVQSILQYLTEKISLMIVAVTLTNYVQSYDGIGGFDIMKGEATILLIVGIWFGIMILVAQLPDTVPPMP